MRPAIRDVLVVVPVHDEQGLLARCLRSLDATRTDLARCSPEVSVHTWVVLDGCRDGSEAIVRRFDVEVLVLAGRCVGHARARGIAAGLTRCSADPGSIWIANTDADSAVPRDWLAEHVRLADAGADVVVGTVRPDPADLSPEQLRGWQQTRTPGRPNGHVHGANFGLRTANYLTAGGFVALPEHEDVDLHARLIADPATVVVASDSVDVLTSGRPHGRTPGGYAGYLRRTFL
jgi:glycosyltransferase involved in cell wall biosynthesis